eukprot:CAMPEP_0115119482 /NCGR_PEP_ID=MMETSP0227-20121206/45120_1 /TAXON_ID=89957 /ORGANISM="Polarella glacialis, Strain CCMP 1383" /LENGTH=43 /DNA_ID= /DNA_START= /DNA_END= /DNA_ORIENTATION=
MTTTTTTQPLSGGKKRLLPPRAEGTLKFYEASASQAVLAFFLL